MTTTLRWVRQSPNSLNNFGLVLEDISKVDSEELHKLLDLVLAESYRGVTLSSRASREFRRWFDEPATALKSEAYVLLSNWFLTDSGNRRTMLASCCENLWDALFPCRPVERLSSPEPGKNHVILPTAFESFWRRLSNAQGNSYVPAIGPPVELRIPPSRASEPSNDSSADRLHATLTKQGLKVEVEGSAPALASFLKLVSSWEAS